MRKPEIIIIGCGVSGLTCGVRLAEAGFNVTIIAASLPPHTTSNVAGAIWYPFLASPEDRVLLWCRRSYETFEELSRVEGTGVLMIEMQDVFTEPIPDPYWSVAAREFRRLGSEELPDGYVDGYGAIVPLIETPIYIPYLVERFTAGGGIIQKLDREIEDFGEISTDLSSVVINCTGLGARELCNDSLVYPVRGQVLSVSNPGITRSIASESDPRSLTYVIPRTNDCILGGTAQSNNWNLNVDEQTSAEILERSCRLEPKLRDARILEVKVGLRPYREEIRLELERIPDGRRVIHNYGHGGAGFTLSWGCAEEVLELVEGG